jgi:hypothetical protein
VNIIASYIAITVMKKICITISKHPFKTPTPAQTRNAGTSAGIFEHNPHFGFEIPSLKPITHIVLCTTLKVFQ